MTASLTKSPSKQQSLLLQNISWSTYQSLVKDIAAQRGIRLTYDRGWLEIMAPLDPHESYKKVLGRFVEAVTEELNIEIRSLGSRTCQREDLERGLEPDQCYYIDNEPLVWNLEQIDLERDPPPDLVIEIDFTSSSINRMDLYATLGVSEVWRYEGSLKICRLENEEYVECDRSPTFPFLSRSEIMRFLELRKTTRENTLLRMFREWVRSQIS